MSLSPAVPEKATPGQEKHRIPQNLSTSKEKTTHNLPTDVTEATALSEQEEQECIEEQSREEEFWNNLRLCALPTSVHGSTLQNPQILEETS